MVGRLIQTNPFCLLKVDKMFFNENDKFNSYQKIVLEYFDYIKNKIKDDSIFRLLSPLLGIFFGVKNGKKFKSEIYKKIKNHEIDQLEYLFLKSIDSQIHSV
jgi:tRNA-dihydrouridine synthase